MMDFYSKYGLKLWICGLLLLSSFVEAQVVFSNNLDPITTDVCTGSYRKLVVSTTKGTCAAFAGNVNSVVFTWQVESSPGVWQDINVFNISGVTYSTDQTINAGGTVITNKLTVNIALGTIENVWNYRVRAQGSGGCSAATSQNEAISVRRNRWTGAISSSWNDTGNWSCGRIPNASTIAVIQPAVTNPIVTANVTAKELILETGSTMTVASGYNITVSGPVTVQGSGDLVFQNNANLMQNTYTGANSGNIKLGRNSSALMRQDYTLWSSPVTGQNLLSFSPSTLTNRFYEYNSATNNYSAVNPSTTSFQTGKGYLIRVPNNHPATPTIWPGQFTGVPNNGTVILPLFNGGVGFRMNAIGNPYPSPVKMSTFVNSNSTKITGTLYFWRKTNSAATDPGYCTWTLAGFVSNGEAQVVNPAGILRTGQGFFVEALNSSTDVEFNNSMRLINNADQFFRQENKEENDLAGDVFKLNISSRDGYKNQMLVGYYDKATSGIDYGIDGKAIDNYPVALTMTIGADDYYIQGKSLFADNDVVPLKFKTQVSGEFTISLEGLEGVFADKQTIYLKDKMLNSLQDLKGSEYRFVSEAGQFDNRFELVYKKQKLDNLSANNLSDVVVYKNNSQLNVQSTNTAISAVKIFDVTGRLLKEMNGIGSKMVSIPVNVTNEVLLIQIIDENGNGFTKKMIF